LSVCFVNAFFDVRTTSPAIVALVLFDALQGLHVDCIAQVRVAYALVPQAVTTRMLNPAGRTPDAGARQQPPGGSFAARKAGGKDSRQMGLRRNSRPQSL
jgi:hypothetical protein